jgi:hypothetical protein
MVRDAIEFIGESCFRLYVAVRLSRSVKVGGCKKFSSLKKLAGRGTSAKTSADQHICSTTTCSELFMVALPVIAH